MPATEEPDASEPATSERPRPSESPEPSVASEPPRPRESPDLTSGPSLVSRGTVEEAGAASTLPALLAVLIPAHADADDRPRLADALRWVGITVPGPLAGKAEVLANRLAGGMGLADALRELAADGDEGAPWAATAVELHGDVGGDLRALLRIADRVVVQRATVAGERAAQRAEARLVVGALVGQPVALVGVGALVTSGVGPPDGVGPLDVALLVLAAALTVVGAWWLLRVTRPPFDWRPFPRGGQADAPVDAVLDRVALAVGAGVPLDEAVRWAAGDRPSDEVEQLIHALHARHRRTGGGGGADPGFVGDRLADAGLVDVVQDAAIDVRRHEVSGTRDATRRIRWLAAIPYCLCLLPASILIIVVFVGAVD